MTVDYPLTPANRLALARAFRQAPRVDLSLDCVIEGQMGTAAVDDPARPTAFRVQAGPFVYFAGDPLGPGGRELLGDTTAHTFIMPSTPGWLEAAQRLWGARLDPLERFSFGSSNLSAEHLHRLEARSRFRERVQRMDAARLATLWGSRHFVDLAGFASADDFLERSGGFYVGKGATTIGAAWGPQVCSRGIEVSLYVEEDYRRQGMATALAARLLLWCLDQGLQPHWDAANPESARLAVKLGYQPAGSYTSYYLSEPS